MQSLSGLPYAEIEFGPRGEIHRRDEFDTLLASMRPDERSHVIVLVHGWNNDMQDARQLYAELAACLREVLDTSAPAGLAADSIQLLGALWPSKRFADRSLIAGGRAASAGTGAVTDSELIVRLDELRDAFDAPDAAERIDAAIQLVPRLDDSPRARDEFVERVRGLAPVAADEDPDDFAAAFRQEAGRDILAELEAPVLPFGDPSDGGIGGAAAAGDDAAGAAAFSLSLGGVKAAAERLVNLTTYYQMKDRAGVVGAVGLNPCAHELRARGDDLGIHLVGHSFGGRCVTAAAAGPANERPIPVDTLTLIQAAFSHFGFAHQYDPGRDGFFRRVLTDTMVRGPILITHSVRDTAVGYAYPLASRLARQVAAGLGDKNDRYGGIGRNGAQRTPEARPGKLLPVGADYDFAAAPMHNLNADTLIGEHSDIRTPELAYALLSVVAHASRS